MAKCNIYDDACRFRRYIETILAKEPPPESHVHIIAPSKIKYVVDKLHIKGLTERWCRENCDPSLFHELKDINTVVCEENFFWL